VVVVVVALLAGPALLGLKAIQDRSGRSALLLEARKQRDQSHRPDLAISYLDRYLELAPNDLEAADERAALLAEAAREPADVEVAIKAHIRLLSRPGQALGADRGAARRRLAGLYLRSNQFRAAEQAARDQIAREPDDVEGRRLLARALEGSGRQGDAQALASAAAEYEAAEAQAPGDVASGERLAALYLDKFADREKAARVVDALLARNPKSIRAHLAKGRLLAAVGDAQGASSEIAEAVRLGPGDVDARLAAATEASRRGDPTAARAHLAAIDPPRPDDLRVKVARGEVELDERRADEGIRDWRDGLALTGGTDADLTWRLAHVLIQLGRPREAAPLVSQYRRLSGGDEVPSAYRYLVGLSALKSGRVAEALAELEAIRDKPTWGLDGPYYLALGQAFEAAAEPSKAADAYARAATAPAAGPAPWLALAGLPANARPVDRAAILERGVAAVGPDESILAALARALWEIQAARPKPSRDWSELDRVLAKGTEVAPNSVPLALVKADRASNSGRPEDGLAALETALRRDPGSAGLRLALAEALASLGRVDEALARLDEATASGGDQAGYRIARARFALAQGKPEVAQAALAENLDRIPKGQRPTLVRALGEFQRNRGRRDAARLAFLEWAALAPEAIDPHLALLNLAVEAGDARAVDAEVEALRVIGGPSSPYWKIARAEALLRDRSAPLAALEEVSRLAAEVDAAAPGQPSAPLLRARLMERRGRTDEAIKAYEQAIARRGGPLAVAPLATLLARTGHLDDLSALRERLGGFPPEVERALASILAGSKPDPEDLARRLAEGDPRGLDPRAWRALEPADPTEAERLALDATRRDPAALAPRLRLLMARVARKDRAGAIEAIEQLKGVAGVTRPALLRANACRAAGLRDLADLAFEDALRDGPDDTATIRSAVDYEEETGRPSLAEPILRRAIRLDATGGWARRRLALNLANRPGDRTSWREAFELLGERTAAPEGFDDRLTRAVVLSLGPEDRRGEAVAALESLAAESPDSPRVQEALARALLGLGERGKAREHASRAAGAADAPLDAIRLAGLLELTAGDLDAAASRVDRLDAMGQNDPASLELKARVLKARGRSAEAAAVLNKALDAAGRSPDTVEFGRGLIRLLTSMGEPAHAEAMARRVATLGPPGPVVLAEWLGAQGRFDESAQVYEAASTDPGLAREAARSALALASNNREPRWATLADRILDRSGAAKAGSGRLDDEMTYALASLRHLQGNLDEAVALYDDLAARSPANLMYLNNGAWILSEELNRPGEGLKRIEAVMAKAGRQPRTLDTRGVILLRMGETSRAVADLEAAAASAPSGPIGYHLARAYLATGRRDDAARTLARARTLGLKAESLQPSERAEFARVSDILR
jgi:tetratricopeptide (TPR) repeat protein